MNPCQQIREACEVSEYAFAKAAGVTRGVVKELEAGLFPDVSQHLSRSLGKLAYDNGVDAGSYIAPWASLNDAYHAWQAHERGLVTVEWPYPQVGMELSPMQDLMDGLELTTFGFCSLIKAPRSPVQRYTSGAQLSMPAAVQSALVGSGYPYLDTLLDVMERWQG